MTTSCKRNCVRTLTILCILINCVEDVNIYFTLINVLPLYNLNNKLRIIALPNKSCNVEYYITY